MLFFVAVFIGALIYVLLQLNGVYNKPDFKFGEFVRSNWIPTVLNLVIGFAMVLFKAEITNLYPITYVSALMLGLGGQAFIKKLSNVFDSKVNTVVGL